MCGRATIRTAPGLAVLLLASAVGAPVQAAEPAPPRADDLIRQGVELRRQGRNTEALERFLRAQEIAPSSAALAQIGTVEIALGRWLEAESHLEQALAERDAWVDNAKNREMLARMLADVRKKIAQVDLQGTEGAEIALDGKPIGRLPLAAPVKVAAGTVRLTGTAAGRQPFEKTLTVAGGERLVVVVDLAPVPPPAPKPPLTVTAPASPAEVVVAPRSPEVPGWRRWTGGALFVAGLAAVGVGAAWIALDGRTNCNAPPGAFCELVYDTKTRGWIAAGAGLAAAGAGATLFFWKSSERAAGVALAPSGVALHGRF